MIAPGMAVRIASTIVKLAGHRGERPGKFGPGGARGRLRPGRRRCGWRGSIIGSSAAIIGPASALTGIFGGVAGQLVGADVDADHARQVGQAALGIDVIVGRPKLGADGQDLVGRGDQAADRGAGWARRARTSRWPCIAPRALAVRITGASSASASFCSAAFGAPRRRRRQGSPTRSALFSAAAMLRMPAKRQGHGDAAGRRGRQARGRAGPSCWSKSGYAPGRGGRRSSRQRRGPGPRPASSGRSRFPSGTGCATIAP